MPKVPLPPNIAGLDITVSLVESLPPATEIPVSGGGAVKHWLEHLEGDAEVHEWAGDGMPVLMGRDTVYYLGAWLDDEGFAQLLSRFLAEARLDQTDLPDGLRIRDTATHRFVFNYAPEPLSYGDTVIQPAGVHWIAL